MASLRINHLRFEISECHKIAFTAKVGAILNKSMSTLSNSVITETTNLFIGGISDDIDIHTHERELFEAFSRYGRVVRVRLHTHPYTGETLGYGVACFENPEAAYRACSSMNLQLWHGRTLILDVCSPDPRREKYFVGGGVCTPVGFEHSWVEGTNYFRNMLDQNDPKVFGGGYTGGDETDDGYNGGDNNKNVHDSSGKRISVPSDDPCLYTGGDDGYNGRGVHDSSGKSISVPSDDPNICIGENGDNQRNEHDSNRKSISVPGYSPYLGIGGNDGDVHESGCLRWWLPRK